MAKGLDEFRDLRVPLFDRVDEVIPTGAMCWHVRMTTVPVRAPILSSNK